MVLGPGVEVLQVQDLQVVLELLLDLLLEVLLEGDVDDAGVTVGTLDVSQLT